MNKKYCLFIGRWQPLHNGHIWLINQALEKGKNVCVGIRDTPLSPSDPYTVEQRIQMINRAFDSKVTSVVIPDIESIHVGRNVGYDVVFEQPPQDIASISATGVRNGVDNRLPSSVENYCKLLKTTIWLTGLPCSGKTTIANALLPKLINIGCDPIIVDGDAIRKNLNSNLGFSDLDRKENIRRASSLCQFLNEQNKTVIASFVSPTNKIRDIVKENIKNLKMIWVNCPIEKCIERDVKGMYKKALAGEIKDFTGISAPFDNPDKFDLMVDTETESVEECCNKIMNMIETNGIA